MNLQTHFEVRHNTSLERWHCLMKASFNKCTCCNNSPICFAIEYSLLLKIRQVSMLLDKWSMFSFFMEDFLYLCTHVHTKTKIVDTTKLQLAFSQNLQ